MEDWKWLANSKLLNVDTTSTKLNICDQDYFHCMVASLLFVAKRAQPNIQVAIAFLYTWISQPTQQDYIKLATVIKYIQETMYTFTFAHRMGWIGVFDLKCQCSLCRASRHKESYRSCIDYGEGSAIIIVCEIKINTKSLTEAQLVGVNNTMNFMVWSKFFLTSNSKIIIQNHQLVNLVKLMFYYRIIPV